MNANSTSSGNSSLLDIISEHFNIEAFNNEDLNSTDFNNSCNNEDFYACSDCSLSLGSFNEYGHAHSYLNAENEEITLKSSVITLFLEDSQSIEFPSDETNNLSIGSIDWLLFEPIVSFVLSSCNIQALSKKIEESPQKLVIKNETTDQSAFFDQKYHYFHKKVCNLSKKECMIYGKEQCKLLLERSIKK